MKRLVLFPCLLIFHTIHTQNLPPTLSGVQVTLGNNNILTISYVLADAENDPSTVAFRAAKRGGQSFDFNTANATGDLGPGIMPGAGKQIQWDFSAYATMQTDFRLMLVADDGQTLDLQALVDQADSIRLKEDLNFIQGIRHRTAGAAHLQAVKNLFQDRFTIHNLETYQHTFNYTGYQAANIIGRKIGTSNETEVYILDGHYDSVNNSPGADDNGSAVAGMLEAVRLLAPFGFKKSIKFIGFDLEEAGLVGSLRYVQNGILPGETVRGVFNLEMIGYYSSQPNSQALPTGFGILFPEAYNEVLANDFRGDFITNVGIENAVPLMNAFKNAAAAYVPGLKVISIKAPSNWQLLTPDLGRSDHAPFWLANIPALMLTDGANFRNPHYHTPNDKMDVLNFTFMRQVVQATIAALAEVAGIQHAGTWWGETQFFTAVQEISACDFQLAPNPAKNHIWLGFENCQADYLTADLIDLRGKIVRQHIINPAKETSVSLDIVGLPKGVYFLRLNGNKGSSTKKMVLY